MYLCSRGVTPRTRHREVQGSNPVIFFFILCFFSFLFFSFAFFLFGSLMLCLSVCLLLFFSYGHSKQTRSLLLLDLCYSAWRAICDSYHGFIHGQRIFFTLCDCRSEGVVPANTLKRLVGKRNYKDIFSEKIYSEVGFEPLPTKKCTIIIQMLYPLSYCN